MRREQINEQMSGILRVLGFLVIQTRWLTPAIEEQRNAEFESRTPGLYGRYLTMSSPGGKNSTEVSEPWLLSMVNAFGLPENSLELKSVTS